MADETTPRPPTKKEPEVLTDSSLLLLANGVGRQDLKGVELAMYLNIPTTTIVRCIGDVTESSLTAEGSENDRMAVAAKCVLLWKEMTKDNKTRERVKSLEKALREIGKGDVADTFMERHSNNQELSNDIFA
ncbi:uncharacterized protein LOC101849360 [Aplysia californica]|uniref:Uncharacterized protein LOC101849360 n=1 Tax=Aplysia californica TaxID=6500 RepID=A0ABM0JI57_APLCA|nr:uncharacterized protein LOC101849360 [Aplysia californica]